MQVLIAGAGIAGLVTAIALRRRGIACRVFEATPEAAGGAGLMLGANALEVLKRLDLLDRVRAAGHSACSLGVYRIDGSPLQVTQAEEWEARYGHRTLVIQRSALQRELLAALDPEIVRYGQRVSDVIPGDGRAGLAFDDGTREEGDVVVGADGLRSMVRQKLFGTTQYRYAGETSWRGISDYVVDSGPRARSMAELWGLERGHRFGFGPVNEKQTYFFATRFAPAGGRDESPRAGLKELLESFAGFVPEVSEILRHTPPERLIRTDIYDFKPLSRWYAGRVVLVGDAAHAATPNLGQGACQAIESAYVLAEKLFEHDDAEAFRAYQALRIEKAHFVTRTSWNFGKIADMPGRFGRWVRYELIPRAPKATTFKQMDRIYRLNY